MLKEVRRALAWHKERHEPSGYQFALSESVDALNGELWDYVARGQSVLLQRPYLRLLERHGPPNLRLHCGLILKDREPVALIAAQSLEVSGTRLMSVSKRVEALRGVRARVLVCGNLLSWGAHGVAFAEGADPVKVWPGVSEAMYRLRRAARLSGRTDLEMVKDVFDGELKGVEALKRFGYNKVETEPNMVLELSPEWKTFDDYLASLSSSYRKNAKKVERDLDAAGCKVEALDELGPHADALFDLYMQVHRAAAVRPVTVTPQYLPELGRLLGDRFRCTVVRRGNELLGFVTTIKETDETAIGYFIGFDRSRKDELPIYFALLQSVVADAIRLRCRRVSLGRTALEPKAKLGAKPVKTTIWLRHTQPILNLFVKNLLAAVPHDEPPERNPFKAAA